MANSQSRPVKAEDELSEASIRTARLALKSSRQRADEFGPGEQRALLFFYVATKQVTA